MHRRSGVAPTSVGANTRSRTGVPPRLVRVADSIRTTEGGGPIRVGPTSVGPKPDRILDFGPTEVGISRGHASNPRRLRYSSESFGLCLLHSLLGLPPSLRLSS